MLCSRELTNKSTFNQLGFEMNMKDPCCGAAAAKGVQVSQFIQHKVAGGPPLGQVRVIPPLGIDQTGGKTSKTPVLSYNLHFTSDTYLCWGKQGSSCGRVYLCKQPYQFWRRF